MSGATEPKPYTLALTRSNLSGWSVGSIRNYAGFVEVWVLQGAGFPGSASGFRGLGGFRVSASESLLGLSGSFRLAWAFRCRALQDFHMSPILINTCLQVCICQPP